MAEKVAKLGISRDKDFMLYVKDGAVWRVRRKQPGAPKGKPEKVADGGFDMDHNYIYFVDKDGDVSRAQRAVGGQKRSKGPRKSKSPRRTSKASRTRAAGGGRKKAAKRTSARAGRGAKTARQAPGRKTARQGGKRGAKRSRAKTSRR
jgi:hypothetical protein